jgi:hypothetical protein
VIYVATAPKSNATYAAYGAARAAKEAGSLVYGQLLAAAHDGDAPPPGGRGGVLATYPGRIGGFSQ